MAYPGLLAYSALRQISKKIRQVDTAKQPLTEIYLCTYIQTDYEVGGGINIVFWSLHISLGQVRLMFTQYIFSKTVSYIDPAGSLREWFSTHSSFFLYSHGWVRILCSIFCGISSHSCLKNFHRINRAFLPG